MPEGPEVETVRRTLEPLLLGQRLGRAWVSTHALRTKVDKKKFDVVVGRSVVGLGRHGKLMWLDAGDGRGVMVRLGMTGRLLVEDKRSARAPHTHVVIPLDGSDNELRYVDPRRFGQVVPFGRRDALDEERARLGPDPLSWDQAQRATFVERLKATERTLKDALLDQRLVAGVGNIYACEALFDAGLSPLARGRSISRPRLGRLAAAVSDVLARAVEHCGTTFSDFVDAAGRPGGNLDHLRVFQREGEPCRACARPIQRIVQGSRSTFWCRRCQKR